MIILIALGFLEKVPKEYYCTYEDDPEKEVVCKPEDFCNDPSVLSYHPNMELKQSYQNWISHYNLTCTPGGYIGLIGSCFFTGWIITLIFIPRISDLNGRQKLIMYGNIVCTLAYALLFISHSYVVLIISMTIMGMMSTIRAQIGTIYLYESLQKHAFVLTYTIFMALEGAAGVFVSLYFMYVSKNFIWLLATGFCMQIVGTIITLTYPESLRWLIKSGQIKEA